MRFLYALRSPLPPTVQDNYPHARCPPNLHPTSPLLAPPLKPRLPLLSNLSTISQYTSLPLSRPSLVSTQHLPYPSLTTLRLRSPLSISDRLFGLFPSATPHLRCQIVVHLRIAPAATLRTSTVPLSRPLASPTFWSCSRMPLKRVPYTNTTLLGSYLFSSANTLHVPSTPIRSRDLNLPFPLHSQPMHFAQASAPCQYITLLYARYVPFNPINNLLNIQHIQI